MMPTFLSPDSIKLLLQNAPYEPALGGASVSILPAIPHHIAAPLDNDCMILFFLPQTHLTTDRKFVTYPEII